MEDHLLQLRRDRRIRGTTDRRLGYAVGDLRGEREQRLDGRQRDPERCDSVHVVLLPGSGADTRLACGLHTHKLWKSHADPNGDTDGNGYGYAYCNPDSYAHANADSYSHSYRYHYRYSYSQRYCHSYCYCYTDAYFHTETNPDAKRYGFAKAATDPAAAPVGPVSQVISEK